MAEIRRKQAEEEEKRKKMNFTFKQLKELNDVTKNDYINKILEEDAQVSMYIKRVHQKVEDTEDQLVEQKMKIEDIKEDWKDEMDDINRKLLNAAIKNGIKRAEYQFIDLKIKAYDPDYLEEQEEERQRLMEKYKDAQLNALVDSSGNKVYIKDRIQEEKEKA